MSESIYHNKAKINVPRMVINVLLLCANEVKCSEFKLLPLSSSVFYKHTTLAIMSILASEALLHENQKIQ